MQATVLRKVRTRYLMRSVQLILVGAALALAACGTDVLFDEGSPSDDDGSASGSASASAGAGATSASSSGSAGGGGALAASSSSTSVGNGGGAAGVICPDTACADEQWCLVCQDDGDVQQRYCRDNFDWPSDVCDLLNSWPLYMLCDGPEDCAPSEMCGLIPGSAGTWTECVETADCVNDCSCGFGSGAVCHTLSDCSACATSCSAADPSMPALLTCQ